MAQRKIPAPVRRRNLAVALSLVAAIILFYVVYIARAGLF